LTVGFFDIAAVLFNTMAHVHSAAFAACEWRLESNIERDRSRTSECCLCASEGCANSGARIDDPPGMAKKEKFKKEQHVKRKHEHAQFKTSANQMQ
jgi:hypothetical protein